jgi:hypothetical protein
MYDSISNIDIVSSQPLTILLILGIFLAVIIFLSVAGNFLVCIAVYTDRYNITIFKLNINIEAILL